MARLGRVVWAEQFSRRYAAGGTRGSVVRALKRPAAFMCRYAAGDVPGVIDFSSLWLEFFRNVAGQAGLARNFLCRDAAGPVAERPNDGSRGFQPTVTNQPIAMRRGATLEINPIN